MLRLDVHAHLGYAGAPIDTTDEDRIRHLTLALPPQHAARLFDAQQQGASENTLRQLTAEALKEVYFQDGGRRAGSLRKYRSTTPLTWSSTCNSGWLMQSGRFPTAREPSLDRLLPCFACLAEWRHDHGRGECTGMTRGVSGVAGSGQPSRKPPPELVSEAQRHPGGWVYEIDGEMVSDPYGEVPPAAIIGAWQVDQNGKLTGFFQANPNYGSRA